jgi:DNA-binding SARP family transcriptional activator/tetratricopeptide (TPR) repeat protein
LGRIEVWRGPRQVDLGRPQQKYVLAVLALEANRVVSVDRLADIVWSGQPPQSSRNALQIAVSRLRRLLSTESGEPGDMQVLTRRPGYVLEADPAHIDVHRFRAAVTAARAEPDDGRRAQQLRAALALWRGSPLEDLPDEVRRRLISGLEQARWSAIEDCVDAELWQGRHDAELLHELGEWVAAQPLREHLAAQYMTALCLDGRRAEALAYYRRLSQHLAEASGLDPGEPLVRLQQAMLRDEPLPTLTASMAGALDRQRPGTAPVAQLPAPVVSFTGRADELAGLDRIRHAAQREDHPAVVALVGPAGAGKTAMALHWSHHHRLEYPDGQLFIDLQGYGEGSRKLTAAEALERFLRALGVTGDDVPTSTQERSALFRSLVATRTLLVVLDNVRSSADVRPLLPSSVSCLTIVTSRNALDGLVARGDAHRVQVGRLPTKDALALLYTIAGDRLHARPRAATRLVGLCDNLPLALRIAAARVVATPQRPIEDLLADLADARIRLDALCVEDGDSAVQTTLASSYRAVPPDAQRLIRLLAIHPGEDLDLPAVAALIEGTPERARRLLGILVDEHLVERRSGERFGMHDLVRLLASRQAERDDSEAARLHAMKGLLHWYIHAAEAAEKVLNPSPTRLVPPAATRPAQTPEFDDVAAAFAWLDRERANLFAAVRYAAEHELHDEVWLLANGLSTYLRRRYYLAEFIELFELGLAAAAASGHPAGEAVMANGLGVAYSYARRVGDALSTYERAEALFERLNDRHHQAAALVNMGCICMEAAEYRRSEQYLDRARVVARRDGNLRVDAVCQSNLGLLYLRLGQFDRAEPLLREALQIAERLDYQHSRATVLEYLGDLSMARSQPGQAARWYEEALAAARTIGDRVVEVRVLRGIATALVRDGRSSAGRVWLADALALARSIGGPLAHDVERQLDVLITTGGL